MMNMEKDILHADNILEGNPSKGFLYIAASSIIFFLFVAVVLIFFPVKSPVSLTNTDDLNSFFEKTKDLKDNISLSQSEVNAFLSQAFEPKTYMGGLCEFPKSMYTVLNDESAEVFLTGSLVKIKFTLSSRIKLIPKSKRLFQVQPYTFSVGKLVLPEKFSSNILEFFNTSLTYTLPNEIKQISLLAGNLILVIKDKKAFVTDRKEKEQANKSIANEKPNTLEITTIDKSQAVENAKSADKLKRIKANKLSDQRADSLHKTADYFHKSRKNAFALKYYQQILDEYPEYTKIEEVKNKIEILKSYK